MKTAQQPQETISIPVIENDELREKNQDRASEKGLESCPCCGKAIKNPKFFFNSIWGGSAYPSNDKVEYSDAWVMGVGSECRKRFPKGYIMKKEDLV